MAEDAQIREIINKHAEYMNGLDRGQRIFGREAVINMVRTALDLRAAEHDARVTGLIRANSQNVIERRYWKAKAELYEKALESVENDLTDYLQDNTIEVFEEISEIDGARTTIQEAQEAASELKPEDFGKP